MAWPNLSVFDLIQSTSNLYSSYVTNTPERDFVERLPANIVREIFVLALFFGSEVKGNVSNTPILSDYCKTTPFPFSQVNHRWRVAVQNMKFLWRQVIVHQPNDAHIYRTEAWMRYVNDGELLVTLRQSNEPTDPEHEATAKILDLFASRVQTCTNGKFYFRGKIPETFLGYLQSLQRQDALALTGITLDIHSLRQGDEALYWNALSSIWETIHSTPKLRNISWRAPFTPRYRFNTELTWLQLHSPISLKDLIDNVLRCTKLIILHVTNVTMAVDNCDEDMYICYNSILRTEFPDLWELDIHSDLDITPFLRRIAVPGLQRLKLMGIPHRMRDDVFDVIETSAWALVRFSITFSGGLDERETKEWLVNDLLDSLETLDVAGAEITNDILLMFNRPVLAHNGDTPYRFSGALEHLTLRNCSPSVDPDILLRMLGSRFWTPIGSALPGPELKTAKFTVAEKNNDMKMYEAMINTSAKRTKDWADRSLKFTLG